MWKTSNILLIFLIIAFIIALVLSLSVVTQNDSDINSEKYKANVLRSQMIFGVVFALGFLVLIWQNREYQCEGRLVRTC